MVDLLAPQLDPNQLGLELGTGAVVGGIVGFAARKLAKLVAVVVGLELALFKYLESRAIIAVDWDRLGGGFVTASRDAAGGTPPSWLQSTVSTVPVSAGFAGGFLVGFRMA